MHISKNVVSIFLVFIFLCSSFSVALQTKSGVTTEDTLLLDNIFFDEAYRTDQNQAQYEYYLKNETMISHSYSEIIKVEVINSNKDSSTTINPTVNVDNDVLMDSCWPMKSQNPHHTGLSPYSSNDSSGQTKWTYEVDYGMESGIAIDNENILYFGDREAYINALYPNGTLKWRYKTDWIWSTPALAVDGTVYVGSYDAKLYALNANGTLKWKTSCGGSISSSPAIGSDGTIYLGTFDGNNHGGYIVAMNPNGTIKWRYETGYHVVSDPAIADDGTIYIGSGDSYLYALNPDGTLQWRFKTGDIVKSHPAIGDDGTIYFDSFDDYLYALNPDGSLKWKYEGVGSGCAGVAIDEDGIIYIGGSRLSAFYPNGTVKWHFTFEDDRYTSHSSPAISADGTIYVGVGTIDSYAGFIYAINHDGTLKWQKRIANRGCDSSPTIDIKGNLYIGSSSRDTVWGSYGEVYAFGPVDPKEDNNPPDSPSIDGLTSGKSGELYTYVINGSDPDGDKISYYVYWGDGMNSGWEGPYRSGTSIELFHTWSEQGSYTVKAKVKDEHGLESDFAYLKVFMPKSRINHGIWFLFDWLKELF